MNENEYRKTMLKLKKQLLIAFKETLNTTFTAGTPKQKIEEFLAFPDNDMVNFEFKLPVQVKAIRAMDAPKNRREQRNKNELPNALS
jgi:hypothetical protein